MDEERRGQLFNEELMREIRSKFCRIDTDFDGSRRLFFENAGGSLRLRSAYQIGDELDEYPDCFMRQHKAAVNLNRYVLQGREDFMTLIGAKSGAIATALTASAVMFKIAEPIVEHGRGTNIVTTVMEHPTGIDSFRYYGEKYRKEVRIAPANRRTGGVDTEGLLSLVDKNTAAINVIAASNMTGAMTDLQTIVTEARKINPDIYIITDAVQHAPHGPIDVEEIPVDAVNIATYKFFGTRGFGVAWVSDRVKTLPHARVLDQWTDMWELGSTVPAQWASLTEIVNYVAWIGMHFTDVNDRRAQVLEGMKRIHLQEQALLYRLLYGADDNSGLLSMDGVETFFDYSDLKNRDLILGIHFDNMNCKDAVAEYGKRGIIVYDREAAHYYSKQVGEFNTDGMVRISPLHCNTVEEIDEFLSVTRKLTEL